MKILIKNYIIKKQMTYIHKWIYNFLVRLHLNWALVPIFFSPSQNFGIYTHLYTYVQ